MEFFNNKKNNLLKFKINSEGLNTTTVETRLILTTKNNKNYIFFGNIVENICTFDIPELKLYEKADAGQINFEIVSGDIYFKVWNDKFNINTQATITLENIEEEVKKVTKPLFSVSEPIVEMINENTEEKKLVEEVKITQKIKEVEEIEETIIEETIIEETIIDKPINESKINEIRNFNDYISKNN